MSLMLTSTSSNDFLTNPDGVGTVFLKNAGDKNCGFFVTTAQFHDFFFVHVTPLLRRFT